MPIDKVSNVRRIPRLGKIHLGIKETSPKTGNPYPKATDYFVVPPEVAEALGTDKPKELPIMFPCEDEAQFAQQWLRCYSQTQGLVCIGDGVTARRKIDKETGNIADHNTKDWMWKDNLTCNPEECPLYGKRCRRVMNLQFLMPTVPGVGVWQIDSSSFHSIVNINSMLDMVRGLCGRVSFIPLTLVLGPVEVTPPEGTKKTVYVMQIKQDVKLSELQAWGQREPTKVLLPEPAVEEPPEDLFPREVLEETPVIEESTPTEHLPIEPIEAPPDEEDPLMIGWNLAKDMLQDLRLVDKQVVTWFQKTYGIEVHLKDFEAQYPPERFTPNMLSRFYDSLVAYQESRKTGPTTVA
ncbi:hypothetical protein M1N82_00365 [Dehalococcoidia bacterium]|nr:hypothetical protein [Dehalococcoidia bacterium]